MRIATAAATDVGRLRPGNEDRFFCGTTAFAVADGLGGHAAGEVAAALAVEPVAELDERAFPDHRSAQQDLHDAVVAANRAVLDGAREHPDRAGMGTTLTAALVHDGSLLLAHVGDSRAYLQRDAEPLRQLTVDHTAVQRAVDAGYLTPEQARVHPERSMLTRVIGSDPEVAVDTPPPLPLRDGDRVLLCSDGLTEPVDDDAVGALLRRHGDPEEACRALVAAALDGGGPDNVTVVVLIAHDDERS